MTVRGVFINAETVQILCYAGLSLHCAKGEWLIKKELDGKTLEMAYTAELTIKGLQCKREENAEMIGLWIRKRAMFNEAEKLWIWLWVNNDHVPQ